MFNVLIGELCITITLYFILLATNFTKKKITIMINLDINL